MFSTVREPSQSFSGIIEDGRYGIELVRFEDMGLSGYIQKDRNGKDLPPRHRIKWVFRLYANGSREPLNTSEGDVFEFYQWTSDATGEKSTARPWFEALLGRKLVPGDGGQALVDEAIGTKAWAMIGTVLVKGQDGGEDRDVTKILSMTPIVAGQKPGAAVQPVAAPKAAPKAEAPLTEDDMAAVPF